MWPVAFACVLGFSLVIADGTDVVEVKSPYREPLFVYPNGILNDRDLPFCVDNMACNLVHQRFWFSPLVMRLCRCLDKSECPWEWLDKDEHQMYINPRAQLKFCAPVSSLHECSQKETALVSRLEMNEDLERHMVDAKCFCPKFHYFDRTVFNVSQIGNATIIITQQYTCKELEDCLPGDFCGHITGNHYQTYYVCTCPQHHLCLMKNKKKKLVNEALYNGYAYQGVCTPW